MLNPGNQEGSAMATKQPGMDAAYAELRKLGYDVAVFDFHFLTHDGLKLDAAPHLARVIITCTENNMHKVYEAVDGGWHALFCADVRAGMFGPPPKGVPFDEVHAKGLARSDRNAVSANPPGRLWK
jgi:hypothetical protein